MLDGKQLTIQEAQKLLKEKQVSSVELTQAALEQIEKLEPRIKAIVTVVSIYKARLIKAVSAHDATN